MSGARGEPAERRAVADHSGHGADRLGTGLVVLHVVLRAKADVRGQLLGHPLELGRLVPQLSGHLLGRDERIAHGPVGEHRVFELLELSLYLCGCLVELVFGLLQGRFGHIEAVACHDASPPLRHAHGSGGANPGASNASRLTSGQRAEYGTTTRYPASLLPTRLPARRADRGRVAPPIRRPAATTPPGRAPHRCAGRPGNPGRAAAGWA